MVISEKVLRLAETCNKVRLRKSTLYPLIARGEFPSPIRITDKAVGWLESELDEWIRSRSARRARATA